MFKYATTALLCLALTAPALAQKTYTPAQLRSMVKSGKYPPQHSPRNEVKDVPYASCLAALGSLVDSVRPEYPTATLVNTSIMRIEKIWTNDAVVVFSCNGPDGKMVIVTSKYR